jgi:hypothetical protein
LRPKSAVALGNLAVPPVPIFLLYSELTKDYL